MFYAFGILIKLIIILYFSNKAVEVYYIRLSQLYFIGVDSNIMFLYQQAIQKFHHTLIDC